MQLLPYATFTIQTQEPLSAVIEKLDAQIEAPRAFRWDFSRNHAPYEGTISSSGFEIRRIIHYRNSFLPNIRGRFESSAEGRLIRVTVKLHPFVIAFLLFWYSVWYSISIPFFLFGALSGDVDVFTAFQFVGLPILLLFVFWCSFWYEANRSRRELAQIILGEPLGQPTSGNLARRAFLISVRVLLFLAIAVIILSNVAIFYFLPSVQRGSQSLTSKYCFQDSTQSPYCDFSVVRTLKGHTTASALAISVDGQTLVSGGQDKAIKVWDLQTGKLSKTLQSDSGEIQDLAIAPDGKTVVSGSGDRMVRIWDITSNQRPQMLKGHSSDIRQVEISSDGKTIISSTYGEIKVWDLTTGQLKATLPNLPTAEIKIGPVSLESQPPRFYPLAISSDGKTALVELNSKLLVWNLATNQQTVLQTSWFSHIYSARISQDGQIGVTTSYRQPVTHLKVWDLKTGTLKAEGRVSSSPNQRGLNSIALTRDSASAAAEADRIFGSTKEGLKVWNLQTAELEAILDEEWMSHLVVNSDGKLLVGITGDPHFQNTKIKVLQRP
jgi:WD40 repeat protein